MSSELVIAICQMTSIDNPNENLAQMRSLIEKASHQGQPEIAFFPENCLYMRLKEGEQIQGFTLQDSPFQELVKLAKDFAVDLHLGSIPLKMAGRLYNSSVLVTAAGKVAATYQKLHLFDISLEGQAPYRESDVFSHGESPQILTHRDWNFGQTICYDLRFSELFNYYAKRHVDALLVPSSFLVKTGEAHWEVLLRARAIESQAFVIAAAQAGTHQGVGSSRRETYGHSLVVDPWGKVIWEAKTLLPEVAVLSLSKPKISSVRSQIPMKNHRRL